ncbi:MAG: formimidoylglutamate deiminase [Chloroflexota bacterium]
MIKQTLTHWQMPGFATVHSHAFQRALRGLTQRRDTQAGSFWSWRGLMYQLAEQIDPDQMFQIARFAYAELAMSGVTAVGEFHYVHHDKSGQPYANRTALSEAVIEAAKAAGIRICLIRTAYMRGGYQQEVASAQKRFVDTAVSPILQDIEKLQTQYAADPMVQIAVAAHSIRGVPLPAIQELAQFAGNGALPFHMHVCEQRRELEESLAEYGKTPIQLLADANVLSNRFVGVHATHLSADEIQALGQTQSFVCICRTTERDLGDGLPPIRQLIEAGAQVCVGVDSHACENAFEEVRSIEFDERSRLEARHVALEAPALLEVGTRLGYEACGFTDEWQEDTVSLRKDDASLAGAQEETAVDTITFHATPRAVDTVSVAGKTIVENGRHVKYDEILAGYLGALEQLL